MSLHNPNTTLVYQLQVTKEGATTAEDDLLMEDEIVKCIEMLDENSKVKLQFVRKDEKEAEKCTQN